MNLKTDITKIHYNKNAGGILFALLKFVSVFYGLGSSLKNLLYDRKVIDQKKVEAYVISIGNLTTGGVGKTPIVAEIANYLISKGEKVAIVSRGYGGSLSNKKINLISDGKDVFYNAKLAGDEPYWLANNTKAVVVTSKNRYNAAKFAIGEFGVTYIILDDGFQHRKLYRDLDLVLIDSEKQFGNNCQLPAGPLRESIRSIKRADKLIIVSKNINHETAEKFAQETERNFNIESLVCKTEPDYIYNIQTNEPIQNTSEIIGMTAIGQPEQFFAFLKDFEIKGKITFDDHHQYKKEDIPNIDLPIVTTEKDAVKLKTLKKDNIYALKLKTSINVEKLLKNT